MSGPPVSIGCTVTVSPGAAGPPDTGVITVIPQVTATANGMQLAVTGSVCTMVNSVSGVPYPLPIGSVGASTGVTIDGQALVRMGDNIPSGSGIMTILGPPAAPTIIDGNAP
ncbi:MAG: hypothetical protein QNJ12_07190 [Ilumatobacter sp.]|uniref:hypothetical protein n=1 Tax=Ilumatobacter sp. TaxID=1967498 RepID=UPI00261BAAD2|nr:hypothetical protein [Ilumatobacter sp.]MDJ0768562.1 hypothetical protein [Ilumatobacter sp.]